MKSTLGIFILTMLMSCPSFAIGRPKWLAVACAAVVAEPPKLRDWERASLTSWGASVYQSIMFYNRYFPRRTALQIAKLNVESISGVQFRIKQPVPEIVAITLSVYTHPDNTKMWVFLDPGPRNRIHDLAEELGMGFIPGSPAGTPRGHPQYSRLVFTTEKTSTVVEFLNRILEPEEEKR